MSRLGTVTITVHPAAATDWEGSPVGDGPSDFTVTGCKKWPGDSTEDLSRGEDVLSYWNVWMPPGSPVVSALDTVTIPGVGTLEVFGKPKSYENGRGVDKGTIMLLRERGAS